MSQELAAVCIVGMVVVAFVILGFAVLLIGGKIRSGKKDLHIEVESASDDLPAR